MSKIFSKKLIYFLLGWLIILGLVQLFLGGEIGYQSRQAAEVEEKIQKLEQENCFLEEKIAQFSSLEVIENKALAQGLIKDTSLVNFSNVLPVALKP